MWTGSRTKQKKTSREQAGNQLANKWLEMRLRCCWHVSFCLAHKYISNTFSRLCVKLAFIIKPWCMVHCFFFHRNGVWMRRDRRAVDHEHEVTPPSRQKHQQGGTVRRGASNKLLASAAGIATIIGVCLLCETLSHKLSRAF